MSDTSDGKPKIIIDEDWKSQAQSEKEELEKQQQEKAKESDEAKPGSMPPVTFETLVSTIATQAMMGLGRVPDPVSGNYIPRLDLAKFHIDTLGVLEEKTKGNLSKEEEEMLSGLSHQLRMDFVNGGYKPPPAPAEQEKSD